jgi:hypothetical protein
MLPGRSRRRCIAVLFATRAPGGLLMDMAHSGRKRHRDLEPGLRSFEETAVVPSQRIFRMTDAEREKVARCLRHVDEARRSLESQHNPDNRTIVRDLRAAADQIYELINDLEVVEG